MMHLFSPFGRNNEARMREHRLVYDHEELKQEVSELKNLVKELKDSQSALLIEVQELRSAQDVNAFTAALAQAFNQNLAANNYPQYNVEQGQVTLPPTLVARMNSSPAAAEVGREFGNQLQQNQGFVLDPAIQQTMAQYGTPRAQMRGEELHEGDKKTVYDSSTKTQNFLEVRNGRYEVVGTKSMRQIMNETREDRLQQSRGNYTSTSINGSQFISPNRYQSDARLVANWRRGVDTKPNRESYLPAGAWQNARVAEQVANAGGAHMVGEMTVLDNPSVREGGQGGMQRRIAEYHLSDREQRLESIPEKYKNDPRLEDARELARRTSFFSGGDARIKNHGLNQYEHSVKSLQQSDMQEQMMEDVTDYAVLPLHTEYIDFVGEKYRQVRITTPENIYGRQETIEINPNKYPMFHPADHQKAMLWGIDVHVDRNPSDGGVAGVAKGVTVNFRKPGIFKISGREGVLDVKGRYMFPAPEDADRGEPSTLTVLNRYGETVATMQTNAIVKNETKKLSNTVSVTRDAGGHLWVKLYDSNTYTILGEYADKTVVTATYRAQQTVQSVQEKEKEKQMEEKKAADDAYLDDVSSSLSSETSSSVDDAAAAAEMLEEIDSEIGAETDPPTI